MLNTTPPLLELRQVSKHFQRRADAASTLAWLRGRAPDRRPAPVRALHDVSLSVNEGEVVGLVGVTLAAGVITWAWSPIKFQADMGILLTFMFVWNMLGALVLIPALSHFLLRGPADARAPSSEPAFPTGAPA